ncbi:HxlR family transcriptional regulator [Bifidobacterium tissieri]|uniref:HxlR family transcriptional regulator n=1 Tax=Bifidobacterium tissieri TaxID=1630162 RepID=A0A261FDF3_9BIFI|nr:MULTISPECIES: helix-turn-helix domain-containing protein [Bifidobacterium]OZG56906.1 HxlR family transcriptional regulator [Bifidobacterium tissieri]TPF96710.1 HxlR family transcriptional regulator [Bifidobacterium sp. UTCIF-39]
MKITEDAVCVESLRNVMGVFGGKWPFLIMGELHEGPKRFNDLNKELKINTKSLSDTLKRLEAEGVISRTVSDTTPVTVEYALTDKGRDFETVFHAMRDWCVKWQYSGETSHTAHTAR